MYTLKELKKQNQDISELLDVLSVLIEHPHLNNNSHVCELTTRLNEKVWMHLIFENNTLFTELSRQYNPDIQKLTKDFQQSAKDVKKVFSHYVRCWCHTLANETEHQAFVKESKNIFALIKKRIIQEEKDIFPLLEKHCSR